jgi:hypothetical protein
MYTLPGLLKGGEGRLELITDFEYPFDDYNFMFTEITIEEVSLDLTRTVPLHAADFLAQILAENNESLNLN